MNPNDALSWKKNPLETSMATRKRVKKEEKERKRRPQHEQVAENTDELQSGFFFWNCGCKTHERLKTGKRHELRHGECWHYNRTRSVPQRCARRFPHRKCYILSQSSFNQPAPFPVCSDETNWLFCCILMPGFYRIVSSPCSILPDVYAEWAPADPTVSTGRSSKITP